MCSPSFVQVRRFIDRHDLREALEFLDLRSELQLGVEVRIHFLVEISQRRLLLKVLCIGLIQIHLMLEEHEKRMSKLLRPE